MKNDINELTEHLFNIDKVSKKYPLETIELLENITNWVTVFLKKLLSEGNSLEESGKKLSIEIKHNYPELNDQAINEILTYAHFVTCL